MKTIVSGVQPKIRTIKFGNHKPISEDIITQSFTFEFTVNGTRSTKTIEAVNMSEAEKLLRDQYSNSTVTILTKKQNPKPEQNQQQNNNQNNNQQESLKREGSFILSEDWFDDLETVETIDKIEEPDEPIKKQGPQVGPDTGIAALLIDAINDEWSTIDKYNSIITMLSEEGKFDMIPVIQDITAEENTHVGQLQELLQSISPNVENIVDGETEAKEQMNGEDE